MIYAAACCTAKNEAAILLEWMAFHRSVGFEKLIIIDNGSTDQTRAVIESFIDRDSVDLISWPQRSTQVDMYNRVLQEYADRVKWIAFIDADEFLYPVEKDDIRHTISEFGEVGAIAAHWHIFGSNGHVTHPPGLIIDNFTRRAQSDHGNNCHVKSIVNIKFAFRSMTSHMFEVLHGVFDDAGNDLHMGPPYGKFEDKLPTHKKLRINHYHCRSKEYYMTKAARGYFGVDEKKIETTDLLDKMFAAHDQNEVEDTSAQRFRPLMNFYLQPNPMSGSILLPQFKNEGMSVDLDFAHSIKP
jgi:glycosyltransferase involved in cell wall biosynthesis